MTFYVNRTMTEKLKELFTTFLSPPLLMLCLAGSIRNAGRSEHRYLSITERFRSFVSVLVDGKLPRIDTIGTQIQTSYRFVLWLPYIRLKFLPIFYDDTQYVVPFANWLLHFLSSTSYPSLEIIQAQCPIEYMITY